MASSNVPSQSSLVQSESSTESAPPAASRSQQTLTETQRLKAARQHADDESRRIIRTIARKYAVARQNIHGMVAEERASIKGNLYDEMSAHFDGMEEARKTRQRLQRLSSPYKTQPY